MNDNNVNAMVYDSGSSRVSTMRTLVFEFCYTTANISDMVLHKHFFNFFSKRSTTIMHNTVI